MVTQKKAAPISMTFTIGADVHTASGESILQCLENIKPTRYLGFGKVTVTQNGKESAIPVRFNTLKLQRVFEKQVDRELFAKRIGILL